MKHRFVLASLLALIVGGCGGPKSPLPVTPSSEVSSSPVVRQPMAPGPSNAPATAAGAPAGTLYVCVVETKGERKQTAIEFAPKVAELCRKNPEMGPCQYERETCRRSGGRVFTADGTEITPATEAEYDKRVMRVRFRAD
jgi:hypothetical protein